MEYDSILDVLHDFFNLHLDYQEAWELMGRLGAPSKMLERFREFQDYPGEEAEA